MTDGAYVLACRFGKTAVKHLKSDDLSAAKRQLLDNVKCLPADTKIPHVPERRDMFVF